MSKLPKGWATANLSDVAVEIQGGSTPSKNIAENFAGDIPFMTVKDMKTYRPLDTQDKITETALKLCSSNLIPAGTPIVCTRMGLGKIVITSFATAINQDLKAIFLEKQLIDTQYFEYWYRSITKKINLMGKGTTVKGITLQMLRGFQLPLPPTSEQTRIATKLDELLAQVDTLKARIDGIPSLLKRFRQSVLAAAVSGRLTEEWRSKNLVSENAEEYLVRVIQSRRENPTVKFKEPTSPDIKKLDIKVPRGWVIASVSRVAECLDSMRIPVKKELRESSEGKYPYFGANGEVDRVDGYIFDDDLVLITEDETFYGREKPIAYKYSGKCWVNNHVHALRAHDPVARDYLCYVLMHYDVTPWLTGTTGRAKLTQRAMLSLPIQVPPPAEQSEIVRRVEHLFAFADQLEARVKTAQAHIDRLTQSILAKAFRGELVPQDPDDEPASVLLDRIKAQRAAAPKPKRGRRATKSS